MWHRESPEPGLKLRSLWGASQKLQEYLSGRSVLAKLQAKHEKLQEAIQRGGPHSCPPCSLPPHPQSQEQYLPSALLPGNPTWPMLLSAQRHWLACRKYPSKGLGLYPTLGPATALDLQATPFSVGCTEDLLA